MELITNVVAEAGLSLLGMSQRLNPYILVPLCLAVFGFVISYFRNYQWPAQRLREQLIHLIQQIKALRSEHGLSADALENKLDYIFEMSPFSHLWAEYRRSLHTVHAQDAATDTKAVLATLPAETFFSKETLIDLQINADFYRHLPGILTGIGIIGTFSGLVWGLHEFTPDPAQALESLPLLLQEVTSAFIGSGLAILAAIFITYKEKSILNKCYRLVEELNKEIDSLHAMGAGEEYLSRLVKVLERGPAATRALQDTLLEDLSRVMHDVAERQSDAHRQQNQALSLQISEAIKTALAEPMAQLSGVVQNVTSVQHDAIGGLLENLLTGFMGKLGDMFGQQIQGINSSMQSSSKTLDMVQDAMTRSIGDISHAGMSAADKMSDKLEDSLSRALLMQQQMSVQLLQQQKQSSELMDSTIERISGKLEDTLSRMGSAQEQMSAQALQQQVLSSEAADVMMKTILAKLQAALGDLALDRGRQIEHDQRRHDNLLTSTQELYAGLSENVGRLVDNIQETSSKTEENLASIQHATLHAVSGMKEGAVVMLQAADRFTSAGDSISGLTGAMEQTASSMQLTVGSMQQAFEEYDKMRGSVQQHVLQLQGLMDMVQRETGVSRDLVSDMERIVGSLADVERQSKEYLDRVSEVLKRSFQDFGIEMVGQVRNVSAESNRQLGASLQALSGTVDSMIASVTKLRRVG